jgi:hypothetical protein
MKCEDYPCCGHGPAPLGDDGGCPDEDGRFDCVLCHSKLPKNARSSICTTCHKRRANMDPGEREYQDMLDDQNDRYY